MGRIPLGPSGSWGKIWHNKPNGRKQKNISSQCSRLFGLRVASFFNSPCNHHCYTRLYLAISLYIHNYGFNYIALYKQKTPYYQIRGKLSFIKNVLQQISLFFFLALPMMVSLRGLCLEVMTCSEGVMDWMRMIGWLGSYVPGTASSRSRHMSNLGETYCNSRDVS